MDAKMDLSTVETRPVSSTLNRYNINIKENYGLNANTGFWWLHFMFEYELDKEIEVRLANFKHSSSDDIWTLEIVKCSYLSITCKEEMASLDMKDELVKYREMCRLNESTGSPEKLRKYLETNILPLIIKKIKYTRFRPQFCFFLSHKSKDKPLMRTFENGLKFLGYQTWLDEANMPVAARLEGALKVSIEKCDCLIAWLNKEYFESDYCKAELLYANKLRKIILPFGVYSEIKEYLTGDLKFLAQLHIYDTSTSSFFEVLRRIDDALFNFESLTI